MLRLPRYPRQGRIQGQSFVAGLVANDVSVAESYNPSRNEVHRAPHGPTPSSFAWFLVRRVPRPHRLAAPVAHADRAVEIGITLCAGGLSWASHHAASCIRSTRRSPRS